jgi:hypothetical protein
MRTHPAGRIGRPAPAARAHAAEAAAQELFADLADEANEAAGVAFDDAGGAG